MLFLPKSGKLTLCKERKIIRKEEWQELLAFSELMERGQQELNELKKELQTAFEDEKKRGYEEGFQEGLNRFSEHFIHFDQRIKELRHEMQKSVLPIALKSAQKIVSEELKLHPERIVDIIQHTLKPVLTCQIIKIYVRKEDYDLIESKKHQIKHLFEHLESFGIEVKEGLEEGSCAIETERGMINSSIAIKLRALESAFERYGTRT